MRGSKRECLLFFSGFFTLLWLPFSCRTLNQSLRRLTTSFKSNSLQTEGSKTKKRPGKEPHCDIRKMEPQIQINTRLLRRACLKLSRTRTCAWTLDSNLLSCDACLVVQFTLSGQIRMIKGSLCALYSVSMFCYLGGVTVTISPTDRRRMHHWTGFATGSWTLGPAGLFKTMKR